MHLSVDLRHEHVRMQGQSRRFFFSHLLALSTVFLLTSSRPAPILLHNGAVISPNLFESLEELARIVDIAYCVGSTGIQRPFKCLSRCSDFEGFELITTWNTGPLLSDSCGYIAISHEPYEKRVLVVFRGTYSIANTIADLSTRHAEYSPFVGGNDSQLCAQFEAEQEAFPLPQLTSQETKRSIIEPKCHNCTIHSGFLTSWRHTRCTIIPHVERAMENHPDYKLVLVGHSLGGAVATIAGLEFRARGYNPIVTTFGEPRLGNKALNQYIDGQFNLNATDPEDALLRRVTHVDDPVPLLPLEEWGYEMHAGEIFISKSSVPPHRDDLHICHGDADMSCIAGNGIGFVDAGHHVQDDDVEARLQWHIPNRYKLWELFFAHRDYFWRLGLCLPLGDPWNWHGEVVDDEVMT